MQHDAKANDHGRKPNSSLTPEQRQEKRRLKRLLKLQSRVHRIETRIRHAISRRDVAIERQAREELVRMVEKEGNEEAIGFVSQEFRELVTHTKDSNVERAISSAGDKGTEESNKTEGEAVSGCSATDDIEQQVKHIVISVSNELFRHVYDSGDDNTNAGQQNTSTKIDGISTSSTSDASNAKNNDIRRLKRRRDDAIDGNSTTTPSSSIVSVEAAREEQNRQAVRMLKAMTKGRQEETMFRSSAALWGYTRQKFVERAMLLCTSFLKLHPSAGIAPSNTDGAAGLTEQQQILKRRVWDSISCVDNIYSIGCGPGNDVLGFLALQRCVGVDQAMRTPRVVLLDWVIAEWEDAIIKTLRPILSRNGLAATDAVVCGKCNVMQPWDDEENAATRSLLAQQKLDESRHPPCELYIMSYLLSETRGKWHDFVLGLIEKAAADAIFYCCEPTPWQLHELIRMAKDKVDFLWVDSSMYHPALQPLEGRTGPAVLLGKKR